MPLPCLNHEWEMKRFVVIALAELCELQHRLPEWLDDYLQKVWIAVIGYHCPFATWSFSLDRKWGLNVWT